MLVAIDYCGFEYSLFGLWHAPGTKLVGLVLGLAIGGTPVSVGFVLATGVTLVCLWPLITVGNLGMSLCLDVLYNKTMLLNLSCYKLACHYFLHLQTTLCTHTCHIF
jgi:hypothetical protein